MKGTILEVHGLSYRPGGKTVLDGVTFSLSANEFLSVIGPNGAGKTTLIKHLNRILPDRDGAVRLHGRRIDSYGFRELARLAAYVPQASGSAPPYPVLDFLLMCRHAWSKAFQPPGNADRSIAMDVLRRMGLAGFSGRYMDTLSGGERQKVFIAAALVQQAPVIFLDEPDAFLDPRHALEINELMQRLHREENKTILMATHDVNAALRLSDRILGLREGRSLYWGPPAGLLADDRLEQLYGTPFQRYEAAVGGPCPPAWLPGGPRT